MIPASKIGLEMNHALLANLPKLVPNPNHEKSPLHFAKGDPTEFGLTDCRMSQEGYDIVKEQIMKQENHSYTMTIGTPQAREAVLQHFGHNKGLKADDVVITSGVNFGLFYIFLASCQEGHNILVPEIGYPFFDMIAPSFGVEVRKYRLQEDKNWEVDLDDLNRLLDANTKFLFIINPSNPCGSVFSKQHVQDIIKWAQDNFVLIVADEVYYGLSFGEFTSFGAEAQDGPIVCLSGMEKIFFVPGWCISWMIFFDRNGYLKEIREAVGNGCQLFLHPNTFVMNSLPHILDKLGADYVRRSVPILKANHDQLVDQLSKVKGLRPIPAQGTFYLTLLIDLRFLDFQDDVEFITALLAEQNLSAFPISCAGSKKYQGLRLLTCIKPEVVEEVIARLTTFCGNHQK